MRNSLPLPESGMHTAQRLELRILLHELSIFIDAIYVSLASKLLEIKSLQDGSPVST